MDLHHVLQEVKILNIRVKYSDIFLLETKVLLLDKYINLLYNNNEITDNVRELVVEGKADVINIFSLESSSNIG